MDNETTSRSRKWYNVEKRGATRIVDNKWRVPLQRRGQFSIRIRAWFLQQCSLSSQNTSEYVTQHSAPNIATKVRWIECVRPSIRVNWSQRRITKRSMGYCSILWVDITSNKVSAPPLSVLEICPKNVRSLKFDSSTNYGGKFLKFWWMTVRGKSFSEFFEQFVIKRKGLHEVQFKNSYRVDVSVVTSFPRFSILKNKKLIEFRLFLMGSECI